MILTQLLKCPSVLRKASRFLSREQSKPLPPLGPQEEPPPSGTQSRLPCVGPSVPTLAERSPLGLQEIWLLAQGSVLCIPKLCSFGLESAAVPLRGGTLLRLPPCLPTLREASWRMLRGEGRKGLVGENTRFPRWLETQRNFTFCANYMSFKKFLNQWHSTSKKDLLGRSKRSFRKVIISE